LPDSQWFLGKALSKGDRDIKSQSVDKVNSSPDKNEVWKNI
jgi:hypothetical protein